jgi:hypothetical protein
VRPHDPGIPDVINKIARVSILPKSGDKGRTRDKFWNVIHHEMNSEVMDVVTFMMRLLNDLKWTRTRTWPMLPITTGISSFAVCLRHTAKAILHSAKALSSVTLDKERSANCTSATASLPSNFCWALGKEKSPSRRQVTVTDPLSSAFCGTRQRVQFCRVFAREALGKDWSSGPHRQSLCREL